MCCRNLPHSWLQTCMGTSSLEMADDDWPAGAWLVPMPHFDSVGSKRSHLNQLLATCYWSAVLPCAAPHSIWYGKLMWHFDICAKLSFIYCQSQQRAMRVFGEGSLSPQPCFLLSAHLCFLSVSSPPPSFSHALITFMCSLTQCFFLHFVKMSPRLWLWRHFPWVSEWLTLLANFLFLFQHGVSLGSEYLLRNHREQLYSCVTDDFSKNDNVVDFVKDIWRPIYIFWFLTIVFFKGMQTHTVVCSLHTEQNASLYLFMCKRVNWSLTQRCYVSQLLDTSLSALNSD